MHVHTCTPELSSDPTQERSRTNACVTYSACFSHAFHVLLVCCMQVMSHSQPAVQLLCVTVLCVQKGPLRVPICMLNAGHAAQQASAVAAVIDIPQQHITGQESSHCDTTTHTGGLILSLGLSPGFCRREDTQAFKHSPLVSERHTHTHTHIHMHVFSHPHA